MSVTWSGIRVVRSPLVTDDSPGSATLWFIPWHLFHPSGKPVSQREARWCGSRAHWNIRLPFYIRPRIHIATFTQTQISPSLSFLPEIKEEVARIGKIQTLNRAHPRVRRLRLPLRLYSTIAYCLPALSPFRFFAPFSRTFSTSHSLRANSYLRPAVESW